MGADFETKYKWAVRLHLLGHGLGFAVFGFIGAVLACLAGFPVANYFDSGVPLLFFFFAGAFTGIWVGFRIVRRVVPLPCKSCGTWTAYLTEPEPTKLYAVCRYCGERYRTEKIEPRPDS